MYPQHYCHYTHWWQCKLQHSTIFYRIAVLQINMPFVKIFCTADLLLNWVVLHNCHKMPQTVGPMNNTFTIIYEVQLNGWILLDPSIHPSWCGIPWNPEVFLLTDEHKAKRRGKSEAEHERISGCKSLVLWTYRSNHKPLLRFLSEILTRKPQKQLLIGLAHSKYLTCAPRASLEFHLFISCPFTSEKTSGFLGSCGN